MFTEQDLVPASSVWVTEPQGAGGYSVQRDERAGRSAAPVVTCHTPEDLPL